MSRQSWIFITLVVACAVTWGFRARGFKKNPAHAVVPTAPPPGMVWIPGGEFTMGTDDLIAWPEEHPAHPVRVAGFYMDETDVTNSQFAAFIEATHYITTSEQPPDLHDLMKQLPPGTPPLNPKLLVAGSLVFVHPRGAVPLDDVSQWWQWTPGASWRHPEGPGSSTAGREKPSGRAGVVE